MPATIAELFAGRTETIGSRARAEICYAVFDAADENEVRALALATIDKAYQGLLLTNVMLDERFNATTWKVRAIYEAPQPQQQDNPEPTFSFDTGGGTQHITQNIATVGNYAPAGVTPPDPKGAIGATPDGVEGVPLLWARRHVEDLDSAV